MRTPPLFRILTFASLLHRASGAPPTPRWGLDPEFTPDPGPDGPVYAVAVAPDDSIWIGGAFSHIGSFNCNGLARLTAKGALAPAFVSPLSPKTRVSNLAVHAGGIVATLDEGDSYSLAYFSSEGAETHRTLVPGLGFRRNDPYGLVSASDGETVVVAHTLGLTFVHPDGLGGFTTRRVDAAASGLSFDPLMGALCLDGQGRIVVGGGFNTIAGRSQSYLARFLPSGDLDSWFVPDLPPVQRGAMNGSVFLRAIALSDGSVVVGERNLENQLVRLDADGRVVEDFERPALPDFGSAPWSGVSIRPSRSLRLANDQMLLHAYPDTSETPDFLVIRSEGSIATRFGVNALPNGSIQDIAMDRRGNLLIVGGFTNLLGQPAPGIARLYGGATDSAPELGRLPDQIEILEGQDLILTNYPSSMAEPVAAQWLLGDQPVASQTSPRLLIRGIRPEQAGPYSLQVSNAFGTTRSHPTTVSVRRYEAGSGSVDLSFQRPRFSGILPFVFAEQADGKVLVAGRWRAPGVFDRNLSIQNELRRLLPDGTEDPGFHPGLALGGMYGNGPAIGTTLDLTSITALAVQRDGKILVGGDFNTFDGRSCGLVARLQLNGELDTSFPIAAPLTPTGPYRPPPSNGKIVRSIALQSDGGIIVRGSLTGTGQIARFQPSGAQDVEFSQRVPPCQANEIQVCADDRLLVLGVFQSSVGPPPSTLARLLPTGALDPSFEFVPTSSQWEPKHLLSVAADGSCVVAASADAGVTRLHRLDAAGREIAVVGDFRWPGPTIYDLPALAAMPDGRFLAGWVNGAVGDRQLTLATLSAGSGEASLTRVPIAPPASQPDRFPSVSLFTADALGRLIVGGEFGTLDFIPRPGLARLNLGAGSTSAPLLHSPGVNAGTFHVEVPTATGKTYFLERTPALPPGPWTVVFQVKGDGTVLRVLVPAPQEATGFYRVRVE